MVNSAGPVNFRPQHSDQFEHPPVANQPADTDAGAFHPGDAAVARVGSQVLQAPPLAPAPLQAPPGPPPIPQGQQPIPQTNRPLSQRHSVHLNHPNQPANTGIAQVNTNTPAGRSKLAKFFKEMSIKKVYAVALITLGLAVPFVGIGVTIALTASPAGPAAVLAGIFLVPATVLLGAALFSLGMDALDREKIKNNKKEIRQLEQQLQQNPGDQAIQDRIAKLQGKNQKLKDRIAGRESTNTPHPGHHAPGAHPGAGPHAPGGQQAAPPQQLPTQQELDADITLAQEALRQAIASGNQNAVDQAANRLNQLYNTQVGPPAMTAQEKIDALNNKQRELLAANTPQEKEAIIKDIIRINSAPPAPPVPPPRQIPHHAAAPQVPPAPAQQAAAPAPAPVNVAIPPPQPNPRRRRASAAQQAPVNPVPQQQQPAAQAQQPAAPPKGRRTQPLNYEWRRKLRRAERDQIIENIGNQIDANNAHPNPSPPPP